MSRSSERVTIGTVCRTDADLVIKAPLRGSSAVVDVVDGDIMALTLILVK